MLSPPHGPAGHTRPAGSHHAPTQPTLGPEAEAERRSADKRPGVGDPVNHTRFSAGREPDGTGSR